MLEDRKQTYARLRAVLMRIFQLVPGEDRPIRILYLAEPWFELLAGKHLGLYSITWNVPGYLQPTIPVMALTAASYQTIAELWDNRFNSANVRAFQQFAGVPEFVIRSQTCCYVGGCDLLGQPRLIASTPPVPALTPLDLRKTGD